MGLKEKIESMIQNKESRALARATCQQPSLSNPYEACGYKLECLIEIQYVAEKQNS